MSYDPPYKEGQETEVAEPESAGWGEASEFKGEHGVLLSGAGHVPQQNYAGRSCFRPRSRYSPAARQF
jgi:hypothetical protein